MARRRTFNMRAYLNRTDDWRTGMRIDARSLCKFLKIAERAGFFGY